VLNWSSGSSRDASRTFRFRLAAAAPRLRVVICGGVSAASSSMASTDVPRSDLIRLPACDSLSAATVSVCDKIDWLRLRSRTEPPARDDAMLPSLVRLVAALRRGRPDRVSGSIADSSRRGSDGVSGSGAGTAVCVGSGSVSFPLPLPLTLDFRKPFVLAGLCSSTASGTKSSIGSGSGRGLAAAGVPTRLCDAFHLLLADTGVPATLCGDRELVGVEKDCLAWVTNGCIGGMPDRPVPGV
jgi:hypothetical protein